MAQIEDIKRGHYKGDEVRDKILLEKATDIMKRYHNPETQAEAVMDMINMLNSYIWECVGLYKGVDEPEDLYNDCALAIIEDIPKYDPEVSSPVKFFKNFSIQRTLNLRKEQKINLSNHYAQVAKKIEKLENLYGKEKVNQMTNEKIAEMINISPKTVQATRKQMHIQLVSDEPLINYADEYNHSPEQLAITKEQREALVSALKELDSVDRMIFLEVSEQDKIKWTDIRRTLMSNEEFMAALGREKLSVGYIEAHYDRARKILIRNKKLQSIRPDYDFSDEPHVVEEYDYLKNQFIDFEVEKMI